MVLIKLKSSAERNLARAVMHKAGKALLCEQVRQITSERKANRRQLNSEAACILQHGEVLAEWKWEWEGKDTK